MNTETLQFLRMSLHTARTTSVVSIVVTLPKPDGISILNIEERMRSTRISTVVVDQSQNYTRFAQACGGRTT